jgi:hypothetical protein
MQESKPLNRKFAIALALVSMWLLSIVGSFVCMHADDWWLVAIRGHDATTVLQIGCFYLAWTGCHLPAACVAGIIISSSDFTHPLRTTFWTMASYHLFFSAIASVRWPWVALHNLDQSVPILAYSVSTLLLIGVSVFFAWFMPSWHKIFQRYFPH